MRLELSYEDGSHMYYIYVDDPTEIDVTEWGILGWICYVYIDPQKIYSSVS